MTHEEILSGNRLEMFMAAYRASSCDATIAEKLTAQGWNVSGKTIHDYRRHLKLPLARRQAEVTIPDAPNENSTIPNEKPTDSLYLPDTRTIINFPPKDAEILGFDINIPDSPIPFQDAWLRLSGDFAIVSDLHIPYHSGRVLRAFCQDAAKNKIRRCVISGDFLDMNQAHPKRGGVQHDRTLNDDFDVARDVLRGMFTVFDEIVYLFGNHDSWLNAYLRKIYDGKRLLSNEFHEFAEGLTISDYEICQLESGGVTVTVPHGANFSGANALGVAQRLAAKFETAVVLGHQHLHCTGRSFSGRHQVVCMGGAHSPRRLAYAQRSPKTHACMTQGYCLLKNGVLTAVDMTTGED